MPYDMADCSPGTASIVAIQMMVVAVSGYSLCGPRFAAVNSDRVRVQIFWVRDHHTHASIKVTAT